MPSQQLQTTPDRTTVERLSTAFNRCFETLDAGTTCSPPTRSSTCTRRSGGSSSRAPTPSPRSCARSPTARSSARVLRVVPTATGFVLEHEEIQRGHDRRGGPPPWLCEVRDGRITEAVGYCNGGWDDELRARHAAEAPMLRP